MEIVLAAKATGANAAPFHVETQRNGGGIEVWPDEVVALAVVDGEGGVLWNKLYRPAREEAWPEDTDALGVTPEEVEGCGVLADDAEALQALLDGADGICVYEGERDLGFLALAGVKPREGAALLDIGAYFAEAWGVPERGGRRRRQSLSYAAEAIGHEPSCEERGALPDALAALAVLRKLDAGWNCHTHRFERHIREAQEKFAELQARMSELDLASIERESERRATDAACIEHLFELDEQAEDIIKDVRRLSTGVDSALDSAAKEVEKWTEAEVERSRRISRAWPVAIWENHKAQDGSAAPKPLRTRR